MARSKKRLTVNITQTAADSLSGIWAWNLERYGQAHAQRYLVFLVNRIKKLDVEYDKGSEVPGVPDLRILLVKRRSKSHGHLVVFRRQQDTIQVLKIYHTAEDWQTKIAELE